MLFIKVCSTCTMITLMFSNLAIAQDAQALMKKVKAKLEKVNDYRADGILTTDIPFMKVPESKVIVYYKRPNKFRIKKQEGISVIPKGGISINVNSLLWGDNYTVIHSGVSRLNGVPVTIVKLLPHEEENEVVLSTLFIDEQNALIRKASTTTKNNGTYDMEMIYGKYAGWGLPDKVLFSFNTKDYKLPKGVTFEYETGEKPKTPPSDKNQKGKVEIIYTAYSINKGFPDSIFDSR